MALFQTIYKILWQDTKTETLKLQIIVTKKIKNEIKKATKKKSI